MVEQSWNGVSDAALKHLIAVWRNDRRATSCLSVELKELPRASTVWCRGWEVLLLVDFSLANIINYYII